MTQSALCSFLLWCTIINFAFLLLWAGLFVFAPEFLYRRQNKFFPMERAKYTELSYCLMGTFKLIILVFNVAPLLALLILH